jgi:predicted ferric reductase
MLAASAVLIDPALLPVNIGLLPVHNAAVIAIPASFAVYIALVAQSVLSKSFKEEFNHKQKVKQIQDLNYTCVKLFYTAKKHTNQLYLQKLKNVMEDRNDIANSYFKGEQGFLKERIVEKSLNLVISYIKLLTNFCIRSKELSEININSIASRMNTNARKLSFVRDPDISSELRRAIEVDERMVENLKEEKVELERISVKLDYMESMVNMFKHQIISSVESEEMLEKLETAVNEADALDNVLYERNKSKNKYKA